MHVFQCLLNLTGTVEPRYNDLRYNDIPDISPANVTV